MENWLSIGVGIFLISMMLYGHYKGFIRLAVSMGALVAALVLVNIAMPQVRSYVKNETVFHDMVRKGMLSATGLDQVGEEGNEIPAAQRIAIENLNLPKPLKDGLLENNNNEVYQMLGVDKFIDYLSAYLTNSILNIVVYILMFFIISIIFKLLLRWMNIVSRLPIISGLNKIAGTVLGLAEGLLFVWIACLVITVFSGTEWGITIIRLVESSKMLSFLYNNNALSSVAMGVMQNML